MRKQRIEKRAIKLLESKKRFVLYTHRVLQSEYSRNIRNSFRIQCINVSIRYTVALNGLALMSVTIADSRVSTIVTAYSFRNNNLYRTYDVYIRYDLLDIDTSGSTFDLFHNYRKYTINYIITLYNALMVSFKIFRMCNCNVRALSMVFIGIITKNRYDIPFPKAVFFFLHRGP